MSKIQNILIETKKVSIYLDKISIYLDYLQISQKSWFVLKVSICLEDLDKNLDTSKSRLKSLDSKNLNREKNKIDLDVKDNLDGFQKLVSTRRTFSISIGLDRGDPQGYCKGYFFWYSPCKQ